MKKYIYLNPDGTKEIGLVVIISADTNVVYAHQCGGTSNEIYELEGFAVPLGDSVALEKLTTFFRQFRGNPPNQKKGNPWSKTDIKLLEAIISDILLWKTEKDGIGKDKPESLELNTQKLDILTEAWIPVNTAYGPGILIFDNSD